MNALRLTSRLAARPSLFTKQFLVGPQSAVSVRFLSDDLKQSIDKAIKENDVCLFMKGTPAEPMCGFSRAVAAILDVHGVKNIKSFNILEDPELRNGIKEYSNWPTIPQVYIKGEFVGGCDIMLNMHQSGELEQLLIKENIISPEAEEESKEKPSA
ncbi:glutaredoxin [Basidiobolus meristosporus CBS 931.73]|uniref:Monothiol glutaredoxin-5, mitochondrial n=1 Tax=Basidiobolus meristosporus CBS 931.73 TaxID=1314790 RepID=A0A1Y1XYF8_9FUNG|nr:glutaredoxin [Basidiobolus meristosporus CBS 931.73]|eukprot:ORX90516.1 glutaredoxin [Basidiobolus meristosporus CBS 931.73]